MRPTQFSANTISALLGNQTIASLAEVMAALGAGASRRTAFRKLKGVRLFCVGGPEGSRRGCERHGKSYLTRRRRGEEGDGGGSLTGGAIPSA